MIRLHLLALLWAVLACMLALAAFSPPIVAQTRGEPDILEIRASSEGHLAEIYYYNSADRNSFFLRGESLNLEFEGVRVRAELSITPQRETLTLHLLNEGLALYPPDPQDVEDGGEVVIQVVRPMF